MHIHVSKAGAESKLWVGDDIVLENSKGFDARTLRELTLIVEENRNLIEENWNEYFG